MSLGLGRAVAISPDGTQVAFVSGGGLYVRSLAELEPKLINNGGGTPVFSPDGGSIALFSTEQGGTVKRIASTGGPPVTLCRVEQPFYGLSLGAGRYRVSATAAGASCASPQTAVSRSFF